MGKTKIRVAYKKCIFDECKNTARNSPSKVFVSVPHNIEKRKLWFEAAGKLEVPRSHSYYCCEDHFNLEQDAENWIYFKMMGDRIMLKDGVVPRKKSKIDLPPQLTCEDRKRKLEMQLQFANSGEDEVLFTETNSDEVGLHSARSNVISQDVANIQKESSLISSDNATVSSTEQVQVSSVHKSNANRREEKTESESELQNAVIKLERDFEEMASESCVTNSLGSVKKEMDQEITMDDNNIKNGSHLHSDDANTLTTIDEAISQGNKYVLQLRKIIIEAQKKASASGIQSSFMKPGKGLEFIRKGLELIQTWSQELETVNT